MNQAATPKKRRSREATEARRARILDAAVGLLGERGYYGFTIPELGKRSGLSNPGLLHYFPSKLDVLLQVLQDLEASEAEFMEPLIRQAEHDAGTEASKDAVLAIFRSIVERATSRRELLRLVVELQAEALHPAHPAYEWCQRRDALSRQFFTDLLRPHVARPEMVARHVLGLMDGLCAQWLRANPALDAVGEWDEALTRFLPELHAAHLP